MFKTTYLVKVTNKIFKTNFNFYKNFSVKVFLGKNFLGSNFKKKAINFFLFIYKLSLTERLFIFLK